MMEHGEDINWDRLDALIDINKTEMAETLLHRHLARYPNDAMGQYYLARICIINEQFVRADQVLKNLLSHDPQFASALYLLSLVNHQLKKFDSELEFAQQATAMEPENPTFITRLAEAQLQSGDIKGAKRSAQHVVELSPVNEVAFELLGDISFQLENYGEAESMYREALALEPEAIHLQNNLARALVGNKKYTEAIHLFYQILQAAPNEKLILDNLYHTIHHYLDKQRITGQHRRAFHALPETVQLFYKDYRSRQSLFYRWSKFTWGAIWLILLIALIALFAMLEK